LAADGVSQREIAVRLGLTVRRLVEADEPPLYERSPGGRCSTGWSRMRQLIEEWPEIKAPRVAEMLRDAYDYVGSVDLVLKRMAAPAAA
jgi:hypothetical protein